MRELAMFKKIGAGILTGLLFIGPAAADSIDPDTFTDTLGVGESVTIRKTVTVDDAPPTTGVLDVMFVFDVTGSMGLEIAAAQTAATNIMTGLAGFGDLQTGSGWYSDPRFDGVHVDLNAGNTGASSGIDDMCAGPCTIGGGGGLITNGGDFDELGYAAIMQAADDTSWRTGSNRFIIAFGDASFKTPPTEAQTIASLTAADANLIGVSFPAGAAVFESDILNLGGTVFPGSTNPDDIVDAIIAGITASFEDYLEVTVDDLGNGLPGVGVSVECVSADTGVCVGDDAVGTYDRSVERMFEFDVTFTGLEPGVHNFDTFALVDGGIVATENDEIIVRGDVAVPEPATVGLLAISLIGLGASVRRRRAS